MQKRAIVILVALGISCLNLGGNRPLGAEPLEIQSAIHVAGPAITIQKPLELSLHERVAAQQIMAQVRHTAWIQSRVQTNRNTGLDTLQDNPFPAVSGMLSDAYAVIGSKKIKR